MCFVYSQLFVFFCSLWVLIVYAPADLWWFLAHVGLSWFVLISVLHFICWCLLVFVGVCWCLLEFVGVCWCLLVFIGVCCCLLVFVGACWCSLVFHHLCSFICSCVFFVFIHVHFCFFECVQVRSNLSMFILAQSYSFMFKSFSIKNVISNLSIK